MRALLLAAALFGGCGCAVAAQQPAAAPGQPSAAPSQRAVPAPSRPAVVRRPAGHPVAEPGYGPSGLVESGASSLVVQPQPPPGSCHASGAGLFSLPDPHCTPGALDPAVDQADIGSTICQAGFTSTIRPPESVTEPEKFASLAAYGDPDDPGSYEYDHLVPLELGGAPNDPRNLWPEPGASPNPKDSLEDRLNELVCSGQLSLATAQRDIATNWIAAYQRYVGPVTPAGTSGAAPPPPAPAGAWCTATAEAANDGYPGDYDVYLRSNQPDQKATASDAGDTWSEYTNGSGDAEITLYHTSPGEGITVTVGNASCSTTA